MNSFAVSVPARRLDLPLCVSSGQVFRWEGLDDGTWLGVDGAHWYLVTPPEADRCASLDVFRVESNATQADFERLFRLDWDAEQVEAEIARRAPELVPYLGLLTGLRVMRPSSPVEVFFCFLCTPNNHLARITRMCRNLASRGPELAIVNGKPLHRFPSVEAIAAIPDGELRGAGFGYRAETIPNAARQVLERGGEEWLTGLQRVTYEEAHASLIGIKGIGAKLADCIALFGLHHDSAVPVDTHMWQALTRMYFPEWADKPLTEQRYRAAAGVLRDKLGDLAGWGHQYLFYENLLNWRERKKAANGEDSSLRKEAGRGTLRA